MDVVYPYKSAPDDFELRYSLRSLCNLPHDRVIVAGDRPVILGEMAQHVPVPAIADRYQSSTANIVAAIRAAEIVGDFVVMHDDIFVLQPWHFRHEHRCTIDEYLRRGQAYGDYRRYVESTRDILVSKGISNPLWFGLHTPAVYNAQRLSSMVEGFAGRRYLLRTLYHNLFPAPSSRRTDVKARVWSRPDDAAELVSISDYCAQSGAFRAWIGELFPDRCQYEVAAGSACLILGYGVTLWADVDRALDGCSYSAVIASPEAAEHWPGDILAIAHDDDHADRIAKAAGFDQLIWCGRTKETA